jgi:hypothetical protein
MNRNSTYKFSWIFTIALAIFMNFAFISGFGQSQTDTSYLRFLHSKSTKNTFKNSLHLVLPPLKPAVISTTKVIVAKPDDKLLANVQVSSPVTDQINLKYELTRSSNITIKILDVLGNDIATPFSQRVEAGERNYTYSVTNKLTRGFYFVRVIAGTESVIKRISVL